MRNGRCPSRPWLGRAIPAGGREACRYALAPFLLGLAGCATPGPLHVYSLDGQPNAPIRDQHEHGADDVPSFLRERETVAAFAYDPFTDHFFLVVQPGNRVRVVDRPARAVKREFPLLRLATESNIQELALKPRTGHLFLLDARERRVLELTRLGGFVRHIPLQLSSDDSCDGLAYDAQRDRLLVLQAATAPRPTIVAADLEGRRLGQFQLDRPVAGPIAFDAETRELYAILPGAAPRSVGVFDQAGRLLRTLPAAGPLLDVGPRSFIRVF